MMNAPKASDTGLRPVACTLTPGELQDRSAAWDELLNNGQVRRAVVPGGIQLIAEPSAVTKLMELVDLERECCAWIDFEVTSASTVTLTAEGNGEAVLAGMFTGSAPL
jgi:hypothetical protein